MLVVLIGCGSVVNNSLTSPGYPNNYPSNMDCNYSLPIPKGKYVKILFDFFDLEDDGTSCREAPSTRSDGITRLQERIRNITVE